MSGSRGAGQRWERLAEKHLRRSGYRIVARNFRAGPGEIDFIATEGPILCFIEVKGRAGPGFGLPEAAVTHEKQRRIHRASEAWLAISRSSSPACRFDVVAIVERGDGLPSIRLFRGAFEAPPASHILPRRR
ncbi:MAG: YraN family protein [Acidobacteriota bacterium]